MSATLKFGAGEWATKKGSTLAYNSENGNFKPLPFTFDRSTSATRVNKEGLIEVVSNNEPRIDFLNDSNGALLLEPSRSNLVTYSEDFSAWNKSTSAIIITPNYGISPDGLQNSSRVQFTSSSQLISKSTSLGTGVTSTGSVYIKGTAGETIEFDTGGVGALKTLTGDWQRIEVTSTSVSSLLLINTFAGATARDIEVWGAQMEAASYATSYIPTQGSIGTRVAESCSQTGISSLIGQTEGTIFVYVDINTLSTDGQVLRLTNGTSGTGRIAIERNPSNQNEIRIIQWDGSILYIPISVGNRYKIAVGYDSSNSNVYVNGSSIGTSLFINVAELNKVSLGCDEVGGSIFNDTIKETKLYNTRLSNTELQALTKI